MEGLVASVLSQHALFFFSFQSIFMWEQCNICMGFCYHGGDNVLWHFLCVCRTSHIWPTHIITLTSDLMYMSTNDVVCVLSRLIMVYLNTVSPFTLQSALMR